MGSSFACAYDRQRSVRTTRLPSSWKTSLLWPSGDARVWPGLRVSPPDSELRACAAHSTCDCKEGLQLSKTAASARGTLKLQGSACRCGVRHPHLLLAVTATIAACAHAGAHAGARARASSAVAGAVTASVGVRALLGLPSGVLPEQSMQSTADPLTVQCAKDAVNTRSHDCSALKGCQLEYLPDLHWTCGPVHHTTSLKRTHLAAVPSFPATVHCRSMEYSVHSR